MKKKTLIGLFLTSSIFLLFIAGCNGNVAIVTSTLETNSEVVETENKIASIEETVQDISSETVVKDNDPSEEVTEDVTTETKTTKTKAIETKTKLIDVKNIGKNKVQSISGMPSADLKKYNDYKASIESANESVDTVEPSKQAEQTKQKTDTTKQTKQKTETTKQTEQKTETTKQKVVKEEVAQAPIEEVVIPTAEATVTNVSQEMANLLNAKRGELGFPQTVEVIPESETAVHDPMKQATINLYAIEFSHESSIGIAPGVHLDGTVIGKSNFKDSTNMFNAWLNSPGHYKTIIPNEEAHIYPEDVMQVVCYVYGPAEGEYFYNLTYRFKPNNVELEDWQKPYVKTTPSEPTPGVVENPNEQTGTTPSEPTPGVVENPDEQTGATVYVEGQTGYVDNYIDEDILNRLAGTEDFEPFYESCSPELQEHYREEHPELFD